MMRVKLGEALAFGALACLLVGLGSPQPAEAQGRAPTAAETGETSTRDQINAWTLGLAGGLPTGTFIRFSYEIARNVNDPGVMRVLPIITGGATGNIKDLLYLKGIDAAITNADVLDHYKNKERIPNIERRINFISEIAVSEVHLVARPEIKSVEDLEGQPVSLGPKGAGNSTTGPIVFRQLGIKPKYVYMNNAIALEKMRTKEVVAFVNNGAKPLNFLRNFKNDEGYHFLPIPIDRFDEYYIPARLSSEDYPGFIKSGETVDTLGIQTMLAVYNWPKSSDRYRRVERFIDRFFDLFERMQRPPYHPKWKSTNLAANVPGWTRYPVAERKLRELQAAKGRTVASRAPSRDATDQERLFQQFLEWSKKQGAR